MQIIGAVAEIQITYTHKNSSFKSITFNLVIHVEFMLVFIEHEYKKYDTLLSKLYLT